MIIVLKPEAHRIMIEHVMDRCGSSVAPSSVQGAGADQYRGDRG